MQDKDKNFRVVIPAELTKAKDGELWKIRGLASTSSKDQQGEVMCQEGMDLTAIDKKRAIINFDHKKGPSNLLGLLDGYTKTPEGLYIEGTLFKNHDKAKAVQQIMSSLGKSSRGRIGLSIEGSIKERAGENGHIIKRSVITGVAVTLNPVNSDTYADLCKSLSANDVEFDALNENDIEFNTSENKNLDSGLGSNSASSEAQGPLFTTDQVLDIVSKALGVGGERASTLPGDLSGGAALSTEELDKKKKNVQKAEVEAEVEDGKVETKVEMDMKDFKEEHKDLSAKLKDRDKPELKAEGEKQAKELKDVESQEKKLKKGGAGSRGGKVIGTTASGKVKYAGSGHGSSKSGAQVKDVKEMKVGGVYNSTNEQFKSKNVFKVTAHKGDRVHGHFVNPDNHSEKRMPSDQTHAHWDSDINSKHQKFHHIEEKVKKGSSEWFQKSILDAVDSLRMLYPDVPTDQLLTALQDRLNTKFGIKDQD